MYTSDESTSLLINQSNEILSNDFTILIKKFKLGLFLPNNIWETLALFELILFANDDGVKSVQFILDSFKKVLTINSSEDVSKQEEATNE